MNKTKIEYLDYSWNPIAMRCTPVSDGCLNCWHLAMAKRLAKNPMIDRNRQTAYAGGPFLLDEKELEAPLHLRKPSRIGVQFMGDIFHERIKPQWIDAIWEVMAACHQHTFLILTKRPQNIESMLYGSAKIICRELGGGDYLPNVWFGVSVSNQPDADKNIPILLQIPAAKRFVSVEPMLASVDLSGDDGGQHYFPFDNEEGTITPGLDWVIEGGETGPGARPLHPNWVRSLRDQCKTSGTPFFFKSWGEWKPWAIDDPNIRRTWPDAPDFKKFGYKELHHFLDGKEWREFLK